jgi:hypothetical protein
VDHDEGKNVWLPIFILFHRVIGDPTICLVVQCAKAMNGRMDIKFEKTRTVFSFSCGCAPVFMPERRARPAAGSVNAAPSDEFIIPDGTWGVVIDDSRIQRKVLGTFLQLIGIDKARYVRCMCQVNAILDIMRLIRALRPLFHIPTGKSYLEPPRKRFTALVHLFKG